ncbi:hypothetical protein EDC56_1825 [Sinobacterium caligoides]|uniref:Uncharacterized protein n=1 Tax=Sinobacterium caligoides TaxID=933926 RepID=A0A3N2DNJ8_9GAMM|nr:hypothetical protein [Sinobacterium caligoides]ROS01384.1 hypothetical protein EDC56_1825 [Sinobacterium caligoides]
MTRPTRHLLTALLLLLFAASIATWLFTGSIFGVGLLLMSPIVGPTTLLQGDYTLGFKLGYLLSIVSCLALMVQGWRTRQRITGKLLVIIGLCAWCYIGLIGLASH